MKLYVCWGTWRRPTPLVSGGKPHPCGVAHEALERAGHDPEVVRALGWKALPAALNQTPGRRKVKELTGEVSVPVLVTDDGEVVPGSAEIAAWAERNPASA
jgi:hypothetical protein